MAGVSLGLHIGDVFCRNIGSTTRPDFTVIGPALNEVSRVALPLGRTLHPSVIQFRRGDSRARTLSKVVLGGLLAGFLFSEVTGLIALWNGAPGEGQHFNLFGEEISKGPDFTHLMLYWLAGWTVACALLAGTFPWNFAGKEIIELNSKALKLTRKIPLFSYSRNYSVANITHLRLVPFPWNKELNFSYFGVRNGPIAFDYGRRTHRLGTRLDEANAHYMIQEMRERVKSLDG